MMPIWEYTDYTQSDSCSSLMALCGFESLWTMNENAQTKFADEEFGVILDGRMTRFVSEPWLILAYFCPAFNRRAILTSELAEIEEIVLHVLTSPKSLALATNAAESTVKAEFERFKAAPPPVQQNMSAKDYAEWLRKPAVAGRTPMIGQIICGLAKLVPTEAGSERAFSLMKKIQDHSRVNLSEENLGLSLTLNILMQSAVDSPQWETREMRTVTDTVDVEEIEDQEKRPGQKRQSNTPDAPLVDEIPSTAEKIFTSVISHGWLNYYLQSCRIIFASSLKGRDNRPCSCGKQWKSHDDTDSPAFICCQCKSKWNTACADGDKANSVTYVCASCAWGANVTTAIL